MSSNDISGGIKVTASTTGAARPEFLVGASLPGLGPGAEPEPVVAERIRVPFAGAGSGRAVLTWGQRDIWATMIRQGNWLPQGGRRPLAPGTRVGDVAAELAWLHSRYPSMRTRLAFEDAAVRQWLVSSGETFLELYDTPTGQDPDEVAASVEAMYRHRPFDLGAEWPIRMAVVRDGDVCAHLVVFMHHLALDAGGAEVMLREVAVLESAEPTGMQPLEQAAWQTSEAGQRHNDRVLRHFAQALRMLQGDPSAGTGATPLAGARSASAALPSPSSRASVASLAGPRQPRHWAGRLTSPVLAAAVTDISARTGVDDSAVLTAAVGIAVARLTATGRVLLRPRVGNRFRPALADVVCFVAQSGLLVLDLAGTSFDEAVARARSAMMAAVKNAYFDPDALRDLLDRSLGGHRVEVFLNDRRSAKAVAEYASEKAPEPGGLPTPRDRSTFVWLHRSPVPSEALSVTLDDAGGALTVSVHFDTHLIAPERAEELAWEVESAVLKAAADGNATTGL
jgi:hypothetical protein